MPTAPGAGSTRGLSVASGGGANKSHDEDNERTPDDKPITDEK